MFTGLICSVLCVPLYAFIRVSSISVVQRNVESVEPAITIYKIQNVLNKPSSQYKFSVKCDLSANWEMRECIHT